MKHLKLFLKSTGIALMLLTVAAATPSAFTVGGPVLADFSGQPDDLDAG